MSVRENYQFPLTVLLFLFYTAALAVSHRLNRSHDESDKLNNQTNCIKFLQFLLPTLNATDVEVKLNSGD